MTQPRVSVIVLAWNGMDYLPACLDAVLGQGYAGLELLVVDNASTDGSADFVAEHYPQVRLIRNQHNLGFSGGNNVGLRAAGGDLLVLLNQDTVAQPGWLAALAGAVEALPGAGVVGCKILDPDGRTLQHAGGYLEQPLALGLHHGHGEADEGQYDTPRQVEFVTGAAMAIKREVVSTAGELDEGFFPGYFEDVDYCYRARAAGYTIWYVPQAVVHHHESASMRRNAYRGHCFYYRNRLRFVLKHESISQIVDQFVPAEIERIPHAPMAERRAAALSTIEGMVMWPTVAWLRRPRPQIAEYNAVLAAFRVLQGTILEPEEPKEQEMAAEGAATPVGEDRGPANVFESLVSLLPEYDGGREFAELLGGDSYVQLRGELDLLNHTWQVTPQPATSQVAVLGPIIAAVRNLVNDLSTRWYMQTLLGQQVAFNANVTRVLNAQVAEFERRVHQDVQSLHNLTLQYSRVFGKIAQLVDRHEAESQHRDRWISDQGQSSTILAEQVARLEWQVLALQSRVSQLEEELNGRRGAEPS